MSDESDYDDIAKKIEEDDSDEESEKEKDKKNKEKLEEKEKKKDEVKEDKKKDKKEDEKEEKKEKKVAKGKEDKKKKESSDSDSSESESSKNNKKKKKSSKDADSKQDKNEKQKEKSEDKNSKKEEPKPSKKRKESSSSSSSSESNKKDDKKKDKDDKKSLDSDDEKEEENKNKKKGNQEENEDKIKEKKEKEEKEKKEKEERERKEKERQKEMEERDREIRNKEREERKKAENEKGYDRDNNNRGNDGGFPRRNEGGFNNNNRYERRNDGGFNNNNRYERRNDGGFNNNRYERRNEGGRRFFDNPPREEINYVQKQAKKYDNNEIKALKSIISENEEIITKMNNAYPELTKLECANVFKNIKNSNVQTIFEIMNFIHREISIQITLNNCNEKNRETYILPIDPFEIIDPLYNNQEHIKVMKYYKVYSEKDKEKLPTFVQKMLTNDFYYTDNSTRRRPLIKYSNGGFNYIPIKCEKSEECKNNNCPYSHNDNEMFYHPLYYKTRFYNSEKEGYYSKNANDYINDFRIIYNYKNENIINLLKLLDDKKIAKLNFRDYYKKKMKTFQLETFKTIECLSIKSGMNCPKDPHLCYYYHNPAERRRPPTLYRYTNIMCPDQKYKENGKIKSSCKNGDFCNKCHSRYEYYYHKLFFGKAITCIRQKKNGKCIYEETCYGYHPYKEKDYKKTKEEKIQEEKDLLMDKYNEEVELLGELIKKYKCQKCGKYNKQFKFYILVNCGHIVCHKCFKENKKAKCPICKEKYDIKKENEDYFALNIRESSQNIDKLIQERYQKRKERKNEKEEDNKVKEEKEIKKGEDNNKGNDDKKDEKKEDKKDEKKEDIKDEKKEDKKDEKKEDKKDDVKNNKTNEKDSGSDSDSENNNSMG